MYCIQQRLLQIYPNRLVLITLFLHFNSKYLILLVYIVDNWSLDLMHSDWRAGTSGKCRESTGCDVTHAESAKIPRNHWILGRWVMLYHTGTENSVVGVIINPVTLTRAIFTPAPCLCPVKYYLLLRCANFGVYVVCLICKEPLKCIFFSIVIKDTCDSCHSTLYKSWIPFQIKNM